MEIVVRAKNTKVEPTVQDLTRDKLTKLGRFGLDIFRVEVDYSEIRNPRVHDCELCEVTVHLKKHFVKAHAASVDQVAALDLVIDKLEHQVTRLKQRKVDRTHKPRRRRLGAPPPLDDWEAVDAAGSVDGAVDGAGEAEIIRTKQFTAKPMTVEEASLQMELLGHDFYLFKDAQTGHATVLYRRRDGHLGLIEAVG
ncbi:MAG TPA: ribosome-associated translation inhibitor RaiA [Acidimicrobiia bacterium]